MLFSWRHLTTSLALSLSCVLPALAQASAAAPAAAASSPLKVMRYAFRAAESGFDPAQITDLYSRNLAAGIFEAPLEIEFLANPARLRPRTLVSMPEVSADFTVFTLRVKPGIYFADDAAFKGQKRELVAADYVYAIKRHYDPRWRSGRLSNYETAKIVGMGPLRQAALKGQAFNYDSEVEGLRTLDRYTFQIRLAEPDPRFVWKLSDVDAAAVAREVVEHYGDKISEHPVGTGPFMLGEWRRSSRIVLNRNPAYREVLYDEHPPEGDARLQAVAAQFKGRRLPLIDRLEVAVIEEPQPRWLAFLNEEQDVIEQLPEEFVSVATPNGHLAPNLRKRGLTFERYQRHDVAFSYFAMEHPLVGGYTPDKVALRRAIGLGLDVHTEARLVRRGQAIVAQSLVAPNVWGYDPALKTEMGEYSPAKARALLDLYGYKDRNGDGWREQPNGQPLVIEYATQSDQLYRELAEQWQKDMKAIGIRMVFKKAQWPENLKASRAGKLMMWGVAWSSNAPDPDEFLSLGYGPNKGQSNHPRFDLPAYNQLYEQQHRLPDGPERLALIRKAQRLITAYMPYKAEAHRVFTDMAHPWVLGYHRNLFNPVLWKYVDIDAAAQAAHLRH